MPKVSIIIITYNRAKYLPRAIDSVLAQKFYDWELIIIDDNSADDTNEIVSQYVKINQTIKFIRNESNVGIVKCRNQALSMCKGKYVAILDSDDLWTDENKLLKQLNFFKQNPDHVLCGTMAGVIGEDGAPTGKIIYKTDDSEIREKLLFSNQFVHSSVVYLRDVANKAGGYGNFGVGEDYDLFFRLGLKGKIANLPELMVNYRRHADGITWTNKLFSAREHLRIIRQYRGKYPYYCLAVIKARLRIIISRIQ
ncbi:MAG: glycosyltransferase family 2 protein [Patescibacteria group bacterium]